MDRVSINDLADARLNRFEKIVRFYDRLSFYLKAKFMLNSEKGKEYRMNKESWEIVHGRTKKYSFKNLPHRYAVRQGQGIIGEYIWKTTGKLLSQEELEEFLD